MFNLQGFIEIPALIDNAPEGAVAPVGELSDQSWSFAKNKQKFAKSNLQVELVAFTYLRDTAKIKVPAIFTDHVLTLTQWIYNQAILGNIKNDESDFQRLLVGQFQSTISDVQTGAMIQGNGNWFPRWVSWKFETTKDKVESPSDVDNQIIVWFSDADFDKDYQGWEIEVQMPIMPVDTFQAVKTVVAKAMESFNLPDHDDKVNVLADGYPFTARLTHNYTWHDYEDYNATLIVPMTLIIYGRAGLNPTRQKQALREYILANSDYGNSRWVPVFPEIFTTTKFTIVPGWSIRGVPNQEDEAALYSPLIPYDLLVKAVNKFGAWQTLTADQKNKNVIPMPTTEVSDLPSVYKSLNAIAIAGPENDVRVKSLHDIISDYALVGSMNPDIARVSKPTTEWQRLYYATLIAAEEYHPYNNSLEVVKMVDDNDASLVFWVFEYNNVEFRVLARSSMLS